MATVEALGLKRAIRCSLVVIGLFTSSMAFGQTRSLSIEETLTLTKENSEEVKLKLNEIERKENQYREALGTALPQLSAEVLWQRYFKPPVFFGNQFPLEQQGQASVNVSQVLWAFGRVGGALKAAKANLELGELEKELTENEIEYLAKVTYYTVLFAEDQLKIAQKNLQNAEENFKILERKFSGGRPPQGDYVRLKSDIAARIPQVKEAEANYEQALMTLAQLVGIENYEQVRLSSKFKGTFPALDKRALLKKMNEEQPQLKMLQANMKLTEQLAKVQGAANLPTLSAIGNYTYSGASNGSLNSGNMNDFTYGGLALQWNIWDGGSSSAKYRQAVNDKTAAELGYHRGRKDYRLKVQKAISTYNSLVSSHSSSVNAVDLAERSFKISQKRFSTGQASVTEVNSLDFALTQTRLALAANTLQIHLKLAEIKNLLNMKNEEF